MTSTAWLESYADRPEWPDTAAQCRAGLAAGEAGYDAVSGRGRRQAGRLYLGVALDWFSARIRESGGNGPRPGLFGLRVSHCVDGLGGW